jgi:hypothetical protein
MALLSTTNASSQPNGGFVAQNLMPGDYILHAAVRTPDAGEQESADVPVTVGVADVEGLVVTTAPNGRIAGRGVLEGDAKATVAPGSLRVSVSGSPALPPVAAQVGATWEFEMKNVEPGKLDLSIEPVPAGWALRRVLAGGRDVTEGSVEVAAATTTTVEVTLTDRPTVLSGTVTQPAVQSAPDDYTVVVFSDDPAHWKEGSRRLTVARPDQHGAFKVVGLPPGRYRAIAVEYLDLGEQWNPEFLGWARSRGAVVELADGETMKANLKLTKYAD